MQTYSNTLTTYVKGGPWQGLWTLQAIVAINNNEVFCLLKFLDRLLGRFFAN